MTFYILNQVRLIMDFIPNHSGKMNEWFKKSQMKEGVYTNYYIWASCDPNTNTYPNNWVKLIYKKDGNYTFFDNDFVAQN